MVASLLICSVCDWWPTSWNSCFIPTPYHSTADKQIKTLSSCQNIVSDDYKPDKEDTDESCSRGVDENELEDETQSEEDIEDIFEKVLI